MPLRPSFLFRYGQVLMLLKRRARALEVFQSVTHDDPRHRQAWNCVGILLAQREAYPQAIDAFRHALALDPADAAAHFNVAFMLQRVGRHADAVPVFERALELDARIDRAWYGLGLSLAKLGRLEDAALRFAEAARLKPSNAYTGYQLAGVWHRLGQRDKLNAEYQRIKGLDPQVAERIRTEFGIG